IGGAFRAGGDDDPLGRRGLEEWPGDGDDEGSTEKDGCDEAEPFGPGGGEAGVGGGFVHRSVMKPGGIVTGRGAGGIGWDGGERSFGVPRNDNLPRMTATEHRA